MSYVEELHQLTFATSTVANLAGVSTKTIIDYCKNGRIKSIQASPGAYHVIFGDSLLDFLYHSPTAFKNAKKTEHSSDITKILKFIDHLPKIYSMDDLCNRFCVSTYAIRYWIKKDYIHPYSFEVGSSYGPTFREYDIEMMFQKVPYIRKKYSDYYRRTASL